MLNCRESYLSNIGEALEKVVVEVRYESLVPLVTAWNAELREMPNGCSIVHFDKLLETKESVELLVSALSLAKSKIDDDKPNSRKLAGDIVTFLAEGFEKLDPIYRGSQSS